MMSELNDLITETLDGQVVVGTAERALLELAQLRNALKLAKIAIQKTAENDSFYGIQPPPYITEWLREYGEMT
jgi:hypothetical protein